MELEQGEEVGEERSKWGGGGKRGMEVGIGGGEG